MLGQGALGVFARAGLIALLSMAVSVTLVPILGGTLDGRSWAMCAACSLLIAFPASFYAIWQKNRLIALHNELYAAHEALKEAHARLSERSRRDAMTGVLNREAFFSELDATRRKTHRGSLLLVDADHIKRINDVYGHDAGDDALIEIAGVMTRGARTGDVIGRIGGEQFGVFLTRAEPAEARRVAEDIRREVEGLPFMPAQGKTISLTVSIGGMQCGPDTVVADLMRGADRQLHEAKTAGRNRVAFESEHRPAV